MSLFLPLSNSLIDCALVVTGRNLCLSFTPIGSCESVASLCLEGKFILKPSNSSSVQTESPHFSYGLSLGTHTSSDNHR